MADASLQLEVNATMPLSATKRREPARRHSTDNNGLVCSLLNWFCQNARDLPWRRTNDPYAIWISEIMLQQTQVKTVISYWTRWMEKLPNVETFARARPQQVLKLWEGLGYYARVRNAHAAAKEIVQKFSGKFPAKFDDVLALPGIGRYTAGALCSIAFNQPEPILDGNAARVLCRIFGIRRDPREKATNARLWRIARELVEAAARETHTASASNGGDGIRPCSALNQALMELGALVCTPTQPKCSTCPVTPFCQASKSGKPEAFPARKKLATATRRRFVAFIVQKGNCFLVRQRPSGGVNAHFWEFPNLEIKLTDTNLEVIARPFSIIDSAPCCHLRHTITRYRIELEAYRAGLTASTTKRSAHGTWRTATQLRQMPLVNAHRRILDHLAAKNSRRTGGKNIRDIREIRG